MLTFCPRHSSNCREVEPKQRVAVWRDGEIKVRAAKSIETCRIRHHRAGNKREITSKSLGISFL